MSLKHPNFDTLQAHAGQSVDATGARVTPIYQTTSFVFDGVEQAREIFNHERPGHIYTRISNPTTDVLERRLAALEGGSACVCFASGMAAEAAVAFTLCKTGDEIVCATALYGGTHTLFADRLPERFGIATRLVDIDDFAAVERAHQRKNPHALFRIHRQPQHGDPGYRAPVPDRARARRARGVRQHLWHALSDAARPVGRGHRGAFGHQIHRRARQFHRRRGHRYGFVPLEGQSALRGFQRAGSHQPRSGVRRYGDIAFATKLRAQQLRDTGACLSPFNAFLLLTGVETLSLRVERHCQNALAIAQFLAASPKVAWVNYPALPGDKYHARQQKYAPKGAGGIFSFGLAAAIRRA